MEEISKQDLNKLLGYITYLERENKELKSQLLLKNHQYKSAEHKYKQLRDNQETYIDVSHDDL